MRTAYLSFIAVFILLVVASPVYSSWVIDRDGRLVISSQGRVLGDNKDDDEKKEDRSGSSGSSDSSGSGSSDRDSSDSSGSDDSRDEVKEEKVETTTSGGAEIRTETKEGETRTETRFEDGTRVKTKTRDGETRTDVYQGGVKVRLEQKDGEVRVKLEDESGDEQELPVEIDDDNEILTIRERADRNEVKVSTASGQFVIKRNQVEAVSNFPLSVDLETNTLSVTTPAGEKEVSVLPDQAVQNMLAANVIDRVGGAEAVSLVELTDGMLAYEVAGVSEQSLLGFIPVQIEKTAMVSVETGELLESRTPLGQRFLDLVSF